MPIRTTYTPLGRPAAYDVGEVLVELKSGATKEVHLESGYYEFSIIGAGGGGGGGTTKSGHKHAGGGAGSGAGFVGTVWFSGGNYIFVCGSGGVGGHAHGYPGDNGYDGGTSYVSYNGVTLMTAQGGAGGHGARNSNYTTPNGRPTGQAGVLSINSSVRIKSFSVKANGNTGGNGYGGAAGAAVDGSHGAGGYGRYKQQGTTGGNGYIKVSYLGLEV